MRKQLSVLGPVGEARLVAFDEIGGGIINRREMAFLSSFFRGHFLARKCILSPPRLPESILP